MANEVLASLRAKPPVRRGYKTSSGWSGEGEGAFRQRVAAWEAAIRRETDTSLHTRPVSENSGERGVDTK